MSASSVSSFPDLFLNQLFYVLSYDEIINLTKVPEWRSVFIEFHSVPINYYKMRRKVIMECVIQHFKNIDQELFSENILDFFQSIGYQGLNQSQEAKTLVYDYVKSLSDVIDTEDIIQQLDENFHVPYGWIRLTKNLVPQRANQMEKILGELESDPKTILLHQIENSQQDIDDLVYQIQLYHQNILKDLNLYNDFIRCINSKLEYFDLILFDQ
jgi:hypothetical protein